MSHSILVVDDDPAIVEAISVILEDEGYKVHSSMSGDSVYHLQPPYPNLILLDIWLSGHNGAELVTYIKSHDSLKAIPVVMISANRDLEKIASQSGATRYLAKPFDIDELLSLVRSLL